MPGGRQVVFQKADRRKQDNPVLGQFIRDPAKQRLGIPLLQAGQHHQQPQVRTEREKIFRRDLPAHHCLFYPVTLEKFAQLPQLPHFQPLPRLDAGLQHRVGFIHKCRHRDPGHPGPACACGHGSGIDPAAGDDSQDFRHVLHGFDQSRIAPSGKRKPGRTGSCLLR